jgi:hypothetical protein
MFILPSQRNVCVLFLTVAGGCSGLKYMDNVVSSLHSHINDIFHYNTICALGAS